MSSLSSLRIFFAALLFAATTGCNIINPAEEQPVYVRIDSFQFLPPLNPGYTVGLTRQIESVFVSYDGEALGAFDLPALIPVLPGSGGMLTVRAGVDDNGRNGFQLAYPYYQFDTLRISAEDAGSTLSFAAKTRYFDSLNYSYQGDFEDNREFNNFLKVTGDTNLSITVDPAYVIDGLRSGLIVVDAAHPQCEIISKEGFQRASSSSQPYLEIDYRCNIPFEIGVYSVSQNISFYPVGVNANTTGAKLYISLEDFTFSNPSASGFRLQLKTSLPSGQSSGYVAVDNLKVVSFK